MINQIKNLFGKRLKAEKNDLQYSPDEKNQFFIAPEDLKHHSDYLASSCRTGSGPYTPSPIEVVLNQSRMGIDNFDYLLTFTEQSCHYDAIKEFLRICPDSSSLIKHH